MTKKPNEERKAEKNLILNQSFSNQPSLQKTSEEIWNRFQRILFDIETSEGENKSKHLSELGEFNHKKWLLADKAVLIEDVEKMIENAYNLYIVPEKQDVPKALIQGINHPISAMRGELLEKLKSLKSQ